MSTPPDDLSAKLGRSNRLRSMFVGLAALSLFISLFARLYSLQVLTSPGYKAAANANQLRTIYTPATRGLILDRNQTVLVGNQVQETLAITAQAGILYPAMLKRVSTLIGVPLAQIKQLLKYSPYEPYQPTPIQYGVTKASAIYVGEHTNLFPGVSVELTTARNYTEGDLAAQVLGYVGEVQTSKNAKALEKAGYSPGDQVGIAGVEQSFEPYLKGKAGVKKLAVNSQGSVVSVLSNTNPVPGGNLELTIDAPLQAYAEQVLSQQIANLRSTAGSGSRINGSILSGAVVIEDVNNGDIYAMASNPTYSPAEWVGGISSANYQSLLSTHALDNLAIQGLYTPGSIFKLATASAALQDGLISPYTVIDDTGLFTIPNCVVGSGLCSFHNSGYEALGPLSITNAIAYSDDVFFYTLGYDFYASRTQSPDAIQQMAQAYGFGSLSGIDLPGEYKGIVDSQASRVALNKLNPAAFPNTTWYAGDQVEMAFGQGETEVTPLQIANAYATFANGGTRYVPQIAAGIVNDNGNLIKSFPPQVAGHVPLSPLNHQTILNGFIGAVNYGTAAGAFVGFPLSQYQIAGKTGTASIPGQAPNAWFVGFGPNPHPQYVIAAVIYGGGFGAVGSAPIVRQLFDYLRTNPIHPAVFGVRHLSAGSTTNQPSNSDLVTTTTTTTAPPTTSTTPSAGSSSQAVTTTTNGTSGVPTSG